MINGNLIFPTRTPTIADILPLLPDGHTQHVNMLQELFQLAATKQEQLLTESGPILAASRANPMASFKLHMTQIKQFPFQMQISG